ncbi:phage major capsid protein [Thioalkalivibrio sp. AKL12]|uniref:phage major capsid protein n=1 Tax=Thioalkalivibrio sp. AKL12 TaxID=1158159 RepID=UPI00035F0F19|nr:phage major capsid protein [Thioalkalivibrio sp. AKL12]
MTKLNETIEGLAQDFTTFQQKQDQRVSQLETALARKAKFDVGASANDGPETKALGDWLRGAEFDRKALSVTSDGQGVTVREDWVDQIFKKIRESSPVRSVANLISTESNEVEVLVDRGEPDSAWTAEEANRTQTDIDFLTRHKIAVHEHYAYPSATQQMLEDSRFDVEGWIQGKVGTRFARQESEAFITGDGNGQPRGILDYDFVPDDAFEWGADPAAYTIGTVYTGVAGDFAAETPDDALYDLVDSLKADYLPGASFLMTRAMRNKIRKLRDGDDRSLLQMSLADGVPDTLLGYQVRLAEDMPELADGAVGLLFGNFSEAYTVVDRIGVSVLRDPYTKPGFVNWYVRKRVGGAVTNPEAVKALILGAEPA